MVKFKKLQNILKRLDSAVVAYSGGVDSSFLLKVARDILGDRVLAVTAVSQTYPAAELRLAKVFAFNIGAKLKIIRTQELQNNFFRQNPENRCYFCKKELFDKLDKIRRKENFKYIIDGSNVDDISDYRPGAKAKKEFGVVSPLFKAGLTKKDIRSLSKKFGLSVWAKPALACLASRIPYHSLITPQRLLKIDKAEEVLRKVFKLRGNLRVRDYGVLARIEVDKKDVRRLAQSKRLFQLMSVCGYKSVVVDPKGYRTGSMNEGVVKK